MSSILVLMWILAYFAVCGLYIVLTSLWQLHIIYHTVGFLSYYKIRDSHVRFATSEDLRIINELYGSKKKHALRTLRSYIKPLLFVKRVHVGGFANYGNLMRNPFCYPKKGHVMEPNFTNKESICDQGLHFAILSHLDFYPYGPDVVVAQILLDDTLKIRIHLERERSKIRVAEANVVYYVKNVFS